MTTKSPPNSQLRVAKTLFQALQEQHQFQSDYIREFVRQFVAFPVSWLWLAYEFEGGIPAVPPLHDVGPREPSSGTLQLYRCSTVCITSPCR
jgi:hypothetical protein